MEPLISDTQAKKILISEVWKHRVSNCWAIFLNHCDALRVSVDIIGCKSLLWFNKHLTSTLNQFSHLLHFWFSLTLPSQLCQPLGELWS